MKDNESPAMPERSGLLLLVCCWIVSVVIPLGPGEAAQVTLAWNPSPSEQLMGYRVRRGLSSGEYDTVFEVGNSVSFTDSSVVRGKTYFYAVSAVSVSGAESTLSRELRLDATSNKRPSITSVGDRTVESGGRVRGIAFSVGDTETPSGDLTVTATSSRPDLVPANLIQIVGTGAERLATIRTLAPESGNATIRLTVSDGELTARTEFQVVVLPAPNRAPQAGNRSIRVSEDGSVQIRLAAQDDQVNELSYQVLTPPEMGRLSGVAPDLVYTPFANSSGSDSFAFVVSDGEYTSAPGIVSIEVQPENDAPTGVIDRIVVLPGGEATALSDGKDSVVDNDVDVDEDALQARLVDGPLHGVVALAPDGTFVYRHDGSGESSDRFTYLPSDSEAQGAVTEVKISVFRVKATISVEDSLVLEWPGQAGNSYQVESRLRSGSADEAPVIATSITPDEDKTLATLIPPEGLSERAFLVRCISEAGELTSEVTIGGSP